jgi:hemerythrin
MAFFTWTEEMSVGIARIDEQHRKLVGFLNELYAAMNAGKGRETLGEVLSQLLLYTKTHFAAEEAAMGAHGFPGAAAHKEKHVKMAEKVKGLCEQYRQGTLASPIQIANFLKEWLTRHIMETDKQYGPYLKSRGVK